MSKYTMNKVKSNKMDIVVVGSILMLTALRLLVLDEEKLGTCSQKPPSYTTLEGRGYDAPGCGSLGHSLHTDTECVWP